MSWIRDPARSFFQDARRALAVALLREGTEISALLAWSGRGREWGVVGCGGRLGWF